MFDILCPGGSVIYIGLPEKPVPVDFAYGSTKEAKIVTIFRYPHVYPKALALMASGKIDVKPLITDRYPFDRGIEAFEYASMMNPSSIKVQIEFDH